MLWYLDFGRKHLHAQQTFLLSLLPRNQNVISEDLLMGFFKVFLVFFTKLCSFLTMFAIKFSLFSDLVVKHGIIYFAHISYSSNTLKVCSKMPYVMNMKSFSNSARWFLVLNVESLVVLIIMRHFIIGFTQSHLPLLLGKLKRKLQIWSWKNHYTTIAYRLAVLIKLMITLINFKFCTLIAVYYTLGRR